MMAFLCIFHCCEFDKVTKRKLKQDFDPILVEALEEGCDKSAYQGRLWEESTWTPLLVEVTYSIST
ncbi:hypothetical protein C4D60_Mb07t27380 [Musa balbisiana]|uniref:Uncharacterized protein n=1 Tax=Musa balbisiana TaxID=52838 RepID=A0A4S8JIE3_MUSBA|nr:hypothetical protein C4D60_Mb07t27380 [Musa balbisiana]